MDEIPFDRWLRARRVERDMDQEATAEALGIGIGKLRRWERGEIPVKLEDVHRIAEWAGVDRDQLAGMLLDELARQRATDPADDTAA